MDNSTVKKQTKDLFNHMNDFTKANELHKKGEAAIFNKHRIGAKEYGPGLREELDTYRKKHSDEWGAEGWRNEQFVKQNFEESRKPTDQEIDDIHKQHNADEQLREKRDNFLNEVQQTKLQKPNQGPKPR